MSVSRRWRFARHLTPIGGPALLAGWLLAAPAPLGGQLGAYDLPEVQIRHPRGFLEYLIPHVAASSHNALQFHRELYDYTPTEPVTVLLVDFSDYGQGGANTVPANFVVLGIAPMGYVYDTIPAIDRMFWMANHEMAHIVTMDQAAGRDLVFRRLFRGKVKPVASHPESILYNYLTNPRWNAPRWYHEGIAVFLETWMAGGLGRVLGAYDEMAFRAMVLDDARFYDVVGLESEGTTIDFQVAVNAYLYGTRFMSYLALHHGPEKLIEWTARWPGSAAYFTTQFRRVYGAPLEEEWRRWIDWEREWQSSNLESLRRFPVTPFQQIGPGALGSVSRAYLAADGTAAYLAAASTGQLAHLARLDLESGQVDRLGPVEGAALFSVTSLAYDPEGERLFYTTDNYGWRDLWVFDLATRRSQRLMRDGRIGDLAFDATDRSLWGVRHFNGVSTLVRIPEPYQEWRSVHAFPYGRVLHDIDISPDGTLLVGSLAEVDGTWRLVSLPVEELVAGRAEPGLLFDFEVSSPANFVFSPDGEHLYGSSTYSGVSNIYRYALASGEMEVLTNAETGFFRPVPLGNGELLAFRYTGQGLVPGRVPDTPQERVGAIRFLGNAIAEEHPIVKEWRVGSPREVDLEALTSNQGEYRSFSEMRLGSVYPVVQGYKNSVAAGLHASFADQLNLSGLDLTLSFSPDEDLESRERLHATARLYHWSWEVEGTYNRADFYDLFGPTKTSRRGYSLGVRHGRNLVFDGPRTWKLSAGLTGWGDLETLPDAQNVAAGTDRLLEGALSVEYEDTLRSLGAVEPSEQGLRWRLSLGGRYAESQAFPRIHTELDRGWLLPIDHSSFWLRGSVGAAFGDADEPFSNFFFGAFGNNYVDFRSVKRYREHYSFPGVDLNAVGGRNYTKLMAEWTLPPVRFREAGFTGWYLNWARTALFAGGLRTDLDDSDRSRTLFDLGVQVDVRMVVFSNLSTVLSVGYARAWERGGGSSDEVMVSLSLL
jgi:hypothetical protein